MSPPVLILPGWLGSGAGHWQSRWEGLYGDKRVEQHDWQHPLRGDWMIQLEEAVLAATQADDYMDRIRSTGAERTVAVDAAASFSRPGPRLIDGIELLAGLLHPEVFPLEEGQIQYREMQTGDRFGG